MFCRVMMKVQKMKVSIMHFMLAGSVLYTNTYSIYLTIRLLLFTMKFAVWYFFGPSITSHAYGNCCFLPSWLRIDCRNVLLLECYVIINFLSTGVRLIIIIFKSTLCTVRKKQGRACHGSCSCFFAVSHCIT